MELDFFNFDFINNHNIIIYGQKFSGKNILIKHLLNISPQPHIFINHPFFLPCADFVFLFKCHNIKTIFKHYFAHILSESDFFLLYNKYSCIVLDRFSNKLYYIHTLSNICFGCFFLAKQLKT